MTNDAERVSDIVARLRPSFVTDLPVVQANSKCCDENAAASLSAWLIANNALKSEAADIIEAQSKALAEARMVRPLKWQRSNVADRWTAWHPWGEYEIVRDQRDQKYRSPQFNAAGAYWNDLDQGQREIGEAHEKRVRSILSTPTPENPNG